MNLNIFNDEEAIKHQEAVHKSALLGKCAKSETFQSEEFSKRAFDVMVPAILLKSWWLAYKEEGLDGLKPEDWPELDEEIIQRIQNRYKGMEFVVQDGVISRSKIADLSESRGWSYRTGERWVSRYQIGGLLGLAPGYDPLKKKKSKGAPPRDLGSLDESALQVVYERHEKLGDLVQKSKITNAEAEAQAKTVGVSLRTIRTWWGNYQKHGYAGLAPRQRSDKDSHHVISKRMIKLVQSIRLTKKDATLEYVFEAACTKAKELGEKQPTRWQVRRICEELPNDVKLLADKRESQYRNSHKITYPLHYSKTTYLLDTNLTDVLTKDMRSKKYRKKSGEVRVYEATAMEANSRKRVSRRLCYDQPNRHTIAATLRDAFLNYGIPDEIWVDRGKDYISNHVQQLAKSLNIKFKILPPRSPQMKGRLERYYRTKNTQLWANVPGYINSNVKLRNSTFALT